MMTRTWVLVLVSAGSLAAQDPPADLRWRLAAGDIVVYEHVVEQKFKFVSEASAFEYVQRVDATERIEACSVRSDGSFDIRHTVVSVRLTVDGKLMYDSAAPEKAEAQTAALFKSLVGAPQVATMRPDGRLSTGAPSTRGRLQNAFGGGDDRSVPDAQALPIAVAALTLPEGPLRDAKAWSVTSEEEAEEGVRMRSSSTFRLDGTSASGQRIAGETVIKLDKSPASMKLSQGGGKHRAVFDATAGHLRECEMDVVVAIENLVEGKTVKVTNAMKCTTRLKERRLK